MADTVVNKDSDKDAEKEAKAARERAKDREERSERVSDLIEQLGDALEEDGRDRNTVDVLLNKLRPAEENVVGNLADLQRLGAINAPEAGEPAFVMPPTAILETEASSGTVADDGLRGTSAGTKSDAK